MSNFGFDAQRTVILPGLNAKLSEVAALQAIEKLRAFEPVLRHRETLVDTYRLHLENVTFQQIHGARIASQFMPARLNNATMVQRDRVMTSAAAEGVEVRAYFSPPLHEQDFFAARRSLP